MSVQSPSLSLLASLGTVATKRDNVNLAIIDATAERRSEATPTCRFATPIANVALINHVLAELAGGGIERARIVATPQVRSELDRILDVSAPRGIEISYLDAPSSDGGDAVLAEAVEALRTEPVMLHPGDSLFRGQLNAMQDRFRIGDVDSVLPEQASADPPRDAEARTVDTVLLLGPETRPLLEELLSPASEGDDLIHALLHSDCRLAVCAQTEHWSYCDSTECLLAANRMVLDELEAAEEPPSRGEPNRLHGRISISSAAFVSNCTVHGPVAIDRRAIVEDSFIGPFTAIGPDAIVRGAEIDNAMILTGAEIRYPGLRIEGSIVGERAQVVRGFDLPRGLHLQLGPDSRVAFSA
ncbi:MAG: hypothetical protein ACRDL5_12200 [Solirubrobacteraceae bacterium]